MVKLEHSRWVVYSEHRGHVENHKSFNYLYEALLWDDENIARLDKEFKTRIEDAIKKDHKWVTS